MAACLGGALSASATVIYSTEATFVGAIQSGYFLNEFNDLNYFDDAGASKSYSGSGYSYTITSPGDNGTLYAIEPGAISVGYQFYPLLVTFTSGNVSAVGGIDFLSDIHGFTVGGDVKVTLGDGTKVTLASGGFAGFVSAGPAITSLEIVSLPQDNGHYASLDHLYVGAAAAPEPTSAVLLLSSGAMLLLRRRRAAV